MLGSHALHISRRGTSEVDEQSVPLASSVAGSSTKPTALFGNKKEKQSRRGSLVDTAFARAVPEAVQLRAIAEVTENSRRASIAIRRQSLIQSLQSDAVDDQPGDPYRPPGRGRISALIPGPPPATSRISAYPGNVYSIAEQGDITNLLLASRDASDPVACSETYVEYICLLHSPQMFEYCISRYVCAMNCSLLSACHRPPRKQHTERWTGTEEQCLGQER